MSVSRAMVERGVCVWHLFVGLQATDPTHLAYAFLQLWYVCPILVVLLLLVAVAVSRVVLEHHLSPFYGLFTCDKVILSHAYSSYFRTCWNSLLLITVYDHFICSLVSSLNYMHTSSCHHVFLESSFAILSPVEDYMHTDAGCQLEAISFILDAHC